MGQLHVCYQLLKKIKEFYQLTYILMENLNIHVKISIQIQVIIGIIRRVRNYLYIMNQVYFPEKAI